MDDGVAAMLRTLNDAFPAVETMAAAEAAREWSRRGARPCSTSTTRQQRTESSIPPSVPSPCGSIDPAEPDDALRPGVVFYHGGGFVLCDIESHDGFCRAMSRHTDSVVVSVGYRLAPEHPAPAAAMDAYAAFEWVAGHAAELGVDSHRIAVAGDSAGGNLAAVTAILCRERAPRGLPLRYCSTR